MKHPSNIYYFPLCYAHVAVSMCIGQTVPRVQKRKIISYALFEIAVRPDIHPKSSIFHEVVPSGIWMTEGG